MRWHYTDGWTLGELSTELSISDDYTLKANEKTPYIGVTATAASKSIILGIEKGDTCFVTNMDSTAFKVKNLEGDTGVSIGSGKCAIVIGGTTASDSFTALVLN